MSTSPHSGLCEGVCDGVRLVEEGWVLGERGVSVSIATGSGGESLVGDAVIMSIESLTAGDIALCIVSDVRVDSLLSLSTVNDGVSPLESHERSVRLVGVWSLSVECLSTELDLIDGGDSPRLLGERSGGGMSQSMGTTDGETSLDDSLLVPILCTDSIRSLLH